MGQIPTGVSFIVAYLLELFLTGVFTVTFIHATYIQIRKARYNLYYNKFIFWSMGCLFLTELAHCTTNIWRVGDAIFNKGGTPAGLDAYFSNVQDPVYVANVFLYVIHELIGDAIMIFRLYHVYDKLFWVCVAPAFAAIAMFCNLIVMTVKTYQFNLAAIGVYQATVQPWITAVLTLACFNNVYCTALIFGRLYTSKSNAPIAGGSSKTLSRAMEIFVESVAPWTIIIFCSYVAFLSKSNMVDPFTEMTPPIIGISFCLIIIRSSTIGNSPKSYGGRSGEHLSTLALTARNGSMPDTRAVTISKEQHVHLDTIHLHDMRAESLDSRGNERMIIKRDDFA